jgi:hypothetical protein
MPSAEISKTDANKCIAPADIVANVLNVDIKFVETLKKEKLVLIA